MQILVIWRNRRQFASMLSGVFRRRPVGELLVFNKVLSKSSYSHNEFKMIVQHSLFLRFSKALSKLKSFDIKALCLYRKNYQIDTTKYPLICKFLTTFLVCEIVIYFFRHVKMCSIYFNNSSSEEIKSSLNSK